MNFSLSLVRQIGVQVIRPNSLSSAYLWYSLGFQFCYRSTESPLNIIASTILQLSFISSVNLFSSVTFTSKPFSFVSARDFNTCYLNPFSQYSSMNPLLLSTIAYRLALQIFSRQSVMVVGWIRQYDITRSGRQLNDQWQVFRLTPHREKGMFTFSERWILSNQWRRRRSSILVFNS